MRIYSHPSYLDHEVATGHPERPERLGYLLQHLHDCGLTQQYPLIEPGCASDSDILRAHTADHLAFVQSMQPSDGVVPLDPDTWMGPHSLTAAGFAAGALCDAVNAVLDTDDPRAFCAVRPPGHHAEADASMGFCLYNSIAIGALAALQHPQVARVAILDFDVHHGNGTVDIFREHPEVLVCSTFQHPFYPHRFFDSNWPNIVNSPLPAGSGGAEFRQAVQRDWLPALSAHQPDLIMVSAGFDGHHADPLAELNLTAADFRWVSEFIVEQARHHCRGRVVSTLEGGYDLQALAQSAQVHLEVLATS